MASLMEVLSKAVSRLSKYNTTRNKVLLFCSVTSAALAVLYNRWLERKALVRRIRQKKKREGSVNIGGIFGMDVGGTLTKIVYFEANLGGQSHDFLGGSSTSARKHTRSRSGIDHAIGSSDPGTQGIKRSSSLGEIYRPDHQEALHALYRNMKDFNSKTSAAVRDDHLSFYSNLLDGHVHFLHFETKNMTASVNLLSGTAIPENIRTIGCTGGGAHKFSKIFEEELSIKIDQYDELGSLIKGMHFALVNAVGECYTYRFDPSTLAPPSSPTVASGKTPNGHYYSHASATPSSISPSSSPTHSPKHSHAGGFGFGGDTPDNADSTNASRDEDEQSQKTRPINPNDAKKFNKRVAIPYEQLFAQKNMFPYLVVNIGSGVSIIKVTAPGEYERISGSSLGGGTYWGLCRLLTKCSSFGEALDLAELGDTTAVDMLVQDIYGGEYKGLKLSGSAVACSFGKMVMKERPTEGIKEEDFALALLMMITNNIGQVSYLNACLHKCSKIFFVGSFLRHNPISCRRLAYSINFWSKSEMEALFLTHEGYFGALGTFLISAFGTDIDKVLRLAQNAKGKSGKGKALAYASNIGLGGREKEGSSETESVSDVSDETNSRNSGVSIYGLDSDFIQRIRKWRPPTFRGVGGAEASEGNASGKCGRDSETGEYKERPTLSINARSVSVSKASNGALESGSRGQKEDRDRNERGSGTSSVPRNGLHSARRAEESSRMMAAGGGDERGRRSSDSDQRLKSLTYNNDFMYNDSGSSHVTDQAMQATSSSEQAFVGDADASSHTSSRKAPMWNGASMEKVARKLSDAQEHEHEHAYTSKDSNWGCNGVPGGCNGVGTVGTVGSGAEGRMWLPLDRDIELQAEMRRRRSSSNPKANPHPDPKATQIEGMIGNGIRDSNTYSGVETKEPHMQRKDRARGGRVPGSFPAIHTNAEVDKQGQYFSDDSLTPSDGEEDGVMEEDACEIVADLRDDSCTPKTSTDIGDTDIGDNTPDIGASNDLEHETNISFGTQSTILEQIGQTADYLGSGLTSGISSGLSSVLEAVMSPASTPAKLRDKSISHDNDHSNEKRSETVV